MGDKDGFLQGAEFFFFLETQMSQRKDAIL